MKVLIVGQGAIGLLWFAKLYGKVDLRLQQSKRSQNKGNFSFTDFRNSSFEIPINNFNNKEDWQPDLIFVCVKSYQLSAALSEIQTFIPNNCPIIITHNGMGCINSKQITSMAGSAIMTLLTTHGCMKRTKSHIIHTGKGNSELGLSYGHITTNVAKEISTMLDSALPNVKWTDSILHSQWVKLLVNCSINPLTAIDNVKNGALSQPKYQKIIKNVIKEVIEVAYAADDIILDYDEMLSKVAAVIQFTAQNSSSMRQDILLQRPSENEFICGFVVRQARQQKVEVPATLALYKEVKKISVTCADKL